MGITGLNFISLTVVSLMASRVVAPCNDVICRFLKRIYRYSEEEKKDPEFRLPLIVVSSILASSS